MSLARTSPGDDVLRSSVFGCSTCILRGTRFRLRIRSVVSSIAPGMGENSCSTPSTLTAVIAAPSMLDRSTRRRAFPTVVAKPRSKGWAVKRPNVSVWSSRSTSRRFGFWKPFHNMSISALRLLRIELDDELLLDREVHVVPGGHRQDLPLQRRRVQLEPLGHAASLHRLHRLQDQHVLGRAGPEADHVALADRERRDVQLLLVHPDVPVAHELAGLVTGAPEAQPVDHVVE